MPTYLGAIDQGTSSTRFIVFDASTRIVAEAQTEHAQDLRSRWVESRRWQPRMDGATRQPLLRQWARAVSRSLDWTDEAAT